MSERTPFRAHGHGQRLVTLDGLRVGYVPYSRTLREPGDRRRFCFYAERRGVAFEMADPSEDYDVVVLSSRADIGAWRRYQGRARLVYELIDSYLALPRFDAKSLLRGLLSSPLGRRNHWCSTTGAIEDMCRRADAVVCSTQEQRTDYLRFCPNVHVILDAHTEFGNQPKCDFALGDTVHLVWEGLPRHCRVSPRSLQLYGNWPMNVLWLSTSSPT